MKYKNGNESQTYIEEASWVVCEEDPQEVVFNNMIQLWIERKISFKELIKFYPDYDDSIPKKLSRILV